jgi:hypothetical protein
LGRKEKELRREKEGQEGKEEGLRGSEGSTKEERQE